MHSLASSLGLVTMLARIPKIILLRLQKQQKRGMKEESTPGKATKRSALENARLESFEKGSCIIYCLATDFSCYTLNSIGNNTDLTNYDLKWWNYLYIALKSKDVYATQ